MILLIDAKTKLPLWKEKARNELLATLGRIQAAVKQNPGYKVAYEFPDGEAMRNAAEFLRDNQIENVISLRVRKP